MTPQPRTLVRALFWAAAAFAFVMGVIPHPPELPGHPSDKVQHVIAFATLGLLGGYAYPRVPTLRLILGLSLFGAAIELVQAVPALNRDSDPLEWVADTIASALIVVAVRWWQQRQR